MEKIKKLIQSEQSNPTEAQTLHAQVMDTEKELSRIKSERNFWESEAKKWCNTSFRYRIMLEGDNRNVKSIK